MLYKYFELQPLSISTKLILVTYFEFGERLFLVSELESKAVGQHFSPELTQLCITAMATGHH